MVDKALMQLIAIDRDQASRNSTWRDLLNQNADALEAAIKQREQGAKDAERYRWLRDKSRQMSHDPDMSGNHHWLFGCNISYALRGPTADAAIDAAMAEERPNG